MLFQHKTLGFGHCGLPLFNLGVVKLFHTPTIEAHQVIVVCAFIQLINSFAALKVAAREQPGLLKLREHAIHRGQANVGALIEQHAVDIFGRHMPLLSALKNLHDLQAWQGGFEAGAFEFVKRGHGGWAIGVCGCKPLQWFDHNLLPHGCVCAHLEMLAMPVLSLSRLFLTATACGLLAACSSFNSTSGRLAGLVSPYTVEVVQGNFVSKEQRQALQPGMPRQQVRDILGSPLLTSVFHADRWDYAFTIRRQGQEPQQRKLVVFFKGDELAKVESDELPTEQDFVASLSQGRSLGKVPQLEASGADLSKAAQPAAPAATAPAPSPAGPTVYPPLEPVR
jgi:outer membrane protein assembly factor BamE